MNGNREDTVLTNPDAWLITIVVSMGVGMVVYNALRLANLEMAENASVLAAAITAILSMWYQKPLLKNTAPDLERAE